METLAPGDHFKPEDENVVFTLSYLSIFYHFNGQGSRKLPPAWEEREEYDSLAPLPVIPR